MLWVYLPITANRIHVGLWSWIVKADAVGCAIIAARGQAIVFGYAHIIGATQPGVWMVVEIVIVPEPIDVGPPLDEKINAVIDAQVTGIVDHRPLARLV